MEKAASTKCTLGGDHNGYLRTVFLDAQYALTRSIELIQLTHTSQTPSILIQNIPVEDKGILMDHNETRRQYE